MTAASVTRLAFLAQIGTTLPLVGLIWLVQIVAYPLFAKVGRLDFPAYHAAHTRLITFVVGPLMVGEVVAALVWTTLPPPGLPRWLGATAFALALSTWLVTFALAVPRHDALAKGFDPALATSLVHVNWLRTIAWTARAAILLWTLR